MARGGAAGGLGVHAGVGVPAKTSCESGGLPELAVHLLLGVKSIRSTQEEPIPSAKPREGTRQRGNGSREGHARGSGKSGNSEAGCTAGPETGRRSARAEPVRESQLAPRAVVRDRTDESGAERFGLGGCASSGRDGTHQGTGGIAASRNCGSACRCTRSGQRSHAAWTRIPACGRPATGFAEHISSSRGSRNWEHDGRCAAPILSGSGLARSRGSGTQCRGRRCSSAAIGRALGESRRDLRTWRRDCSASTFHAGSRSRRRQWARSFCEWSGRGRGASATVGAKRKWRRVDGDIELVVLE